MLKNKKNYTSQFNALLASPEMDVYREPERKLDAANEAQLTKVEKHIRRSRFYVPINDPGSKADIPAGIFVEAKDLSPFKIRPAKEDTPRRYRVYYDNPDLDGFFGGIEIRIEHPKATEHGHAKPFKQTIKLGKAATNEDPTFHRIEISGRLSRAVPSFEPSALDNNKKLSAFLKEHIDCDQLRPLQLLDTGRTRYYCRPDGCAQTVVEFGSDRGQILTLTNVKFPILQIEPEVLTGDESVLADISDRLTAKFNSQQIWVNLESKPAPGFNALAEVLRGNKKAKNFILGLPRDTFRVISPEECAALYPHL